MVQNLAGIVENATLGSADDIFDAFSFKSAAWQRGIQVVYVSLKVFSVMKCNGFSADNRRKGILGVRQGHGGKLIAGHIDISLLQI